MHAFRGDVPGSFPDSTDYILNLNLHVHVVLPACTAKDVYLSNVLRNFERVFESQVFGLKEEDWNMWDIVPE